MRTLRNQTIIAFILFFSITSCVKLPCVYVQSGQINGYGFRDGKAFFPNDSAIGKIDSTKCLEAPKREFNGFKMADGKVYVFGEKSIPKKFKKMNLVNLTNTLSQANWGRDGWEYKLKKDALICEDTVNSIFYSRSAGTTKRDSATVFGKKIYRFVDSVYREDYSKLKNYHLIFNPNVNFFEILGIDTTTHIMTSERVKILPLEGKIDPNNDTTQFEYDRIYFKPKKQITNQIKKVDRIQNLISKNQSYLIRLVLIKHNDINRNKYFDPSNSYIVRDSTALTNYLYGHLLPKYRPEFIRRFDCNGCKKYGINITSLLPNELPSNLKSIDEESGSIVPPLPIVVNR